MLFGQYPFFGTSAGEIYRSIKKTVNKLQFTKEVSDDAKDLLNKIF